MVTRAAKHQRVNLMKFRRCELAAATGGVLGATATDGLPAFGVGVVSGLGMETGGGLGFTADSMARGSWVSAGSCNIITYFEQEQMGLPENSGWFFSSRHAPRDGASSRGA